MTCIGALSAGDLSQRRSVRFCAIGAFLEIVVYPALHSFGVSVLVAIGVLISTVPYIQVLFRYRMAFRDAAGEARRFTGG